MCDAFSGAVAELLFQPSELLQFPTKILLFDETVENGDAERG